MCILLMLLLCFNLRSLTFVDNYFVIAIADVVFSDMESSDDQSRLHENHEPPREGGG